MPLQTAYPLVNATPLAGVLPPAYGTSTFAGALSTAYGNTEFVILNKFGKYEGITYTQSGNLTYFDSTGTLQTAAVDTMVLDYDPSTLVLRGYPFWEARTNLLLQSEDFATTWALAGTGTPSVTVNSATSPAGTLTADKITGAGTTSNRVQQTVTVANSTTYVISFFVKNFDAVTSQFHVANTSSGTANSETTINWSGSTITGFNNTGTTVGVAVSLPNNWYRVYFAFTTNGSDAGTSTVRFYPNGNGASAKSTCIIQADH